MGQDWSRWGIPPSWCLEHFERTLDRLKEGLARLPLREVLVLGDFNAKATLWGPAWTDTRGETLIQWAASANLFLLNRGNVQGSAHVYGGRGIHRRHRVGPSTSSTTGETLENNGGGGDTQ